MTAYNVVRMRVKPGREQDFMTAVKSLNRNFKGLRKASMIKTGEGSYCFIGEWNSMQDNVDARPEMIKDLDRWRDLLEDLGGGLGVTDPVSGETVGEVMAGWPPWGLGDRYYRLAPFGAAPLTISQARRQHTREVTYSARPGDGRTRQSRRQPRRRHRRGRRSSQGRGASWQHR
jgi:hypothetical protein